MHLCPLLTSPTEFYTALGLDVRCFLFSSFVNLLEVDVLLPVTVENNVGFESFC